MLKRIISAFINRVLFIINVDNKALQGKHISVSRGSYIDSRTRIGDYTSIGRNCEITATKIGRYCSIANKVQIGAGEHSLDTVSTSGLLPQKIEHTELIIGNDVWIGASCIIRRGVKIGNGAVIGANSFVNKDVPDYAVVAGSPAKIIKYRFSHKVISELLNTKWWELEKSEIIEIYPSLEKIINNNNV